MAATLRTALARAFACAALLVGVGVGTADSAVAAEPGGGDAGGTTLITVGASTPAPRTMRVAPPQVLQPLTVDPASTRPGGIVDLSTFADCGGTSTGEVRSAAFTAPVALALAADGGLYAEARIAANAAPGTYLVHEFCFGRPVAAGQLTVADLGDLGPSATGGRWDARHGSGLRQLAAAPPGPTGSLGFRVSAAAADGSAGSAETEGLVRNGVLGVLLACGAAYSVVVLRRRAASADA